MCYCSFIVCWTLMLDILVSTAQRQAIFWHITSQILFVWTNPGQFFNTKQRKSYQPSHLMLSDHVDQIKLLFWTATLEIVNWKSAQDDAMSSGKHILNIYFLFICFLTMFVIHQNTEANSLPKSCATIKKTRTKERSARQISSNPVHSLNSAEVNSHCVKQTSTFWSRERRESYRNAPRRCCPTDTLRLVYTSEKGET